MPESTTATMTLLEAVWRSHASGASMSASLAWLSPRAPEARVVRRRRGVVDPVRLGVEHVGAPLERSGRRCDGPTLRDADEFRTGKAKLTFDLHPWLLSTAARAAARDTGMNRTISSSGTKARLSARGANVVLGDAAAEIPPPSSTASPLNAASAASRS
jgi:hypothetical protein